MLTEKIERVCDAFSGQRFAIPDINLIPAQISQVTNQIASAKQTYEMTKKSLKEQLIKFDQIQAEVADSGDGG